MDQFPFVVFTAEDFRHPQILSDCLVLALHHNLRPLNASQKGQSTVNCDLLDFKTAFATWPEHLSTARVGCVYMARALNTVSHRAKNRRGRVVGGHPVQRSRIAIDERLGRSFPRFHELLEIVKVVHRVCPILLFCVARPECGKTMLLLHASKHRYRWLQFRAAFIQNADDFGGKTGRSCGWSRNQISGADGMIRILIMRMPCVVWHLFFNPSAAIARVFAVTEKASTRRCQGTRANDADDHAALVASPQGRPDVYGVLVRPALRAADNNRVKIARFRLSKNRELCT